MINLPFISLFVSFVFGVLAWRKRREFRTRPYWHWFVYLHMAAVGLHQFEEYGWPGGFRDAFVTVFNSPGAAGWVPSLATLQALNALGLTTAFFLLGLMGTRVVWVGLALLFINFGNGFFHLIYSIAHMAYVPGTVTGTLLYLPLGLLALRHAVMHGDITLAKLLLAFTVGTAASLLPFIHVWLMHVAS